MIFREKNHLVGLDIGSKSLKVGEITETKDGHRLRNFGMLDVTSEVIEEGVINNPEEVAHSIRQLFKASGVREKNVAISISGHSVIAKTVDIQAEEEDQLHETVYFEAERHIPFDIGDVNLDFQVLGESENNPDQINVLLVAAKKEIIDNYVNLVQMAGLHPRIIDVDAFALQNIFELNYGINDESVVLVDVGSRKISLNILKGNSSVFTRDVPLGCKQIDQKIVSLVGCSLEEAEQIKQGKKPGRIPPEDLREAVSSVVASWCSEIRLALDFFYSIYHDDQIKRIVLSGGGSNIKEFRQFLAKETSSRIEIIDPFRNLHVDDRYFDSSYIKQIAPQAAICMGLATRRIDDK